MSGGGTRKRKSGQHRDDLYRLLVDAAIGYAIFTLDDQGKIATWNSGAERLIGYEEGEVLGKEGDIIFTSEDRAAGVPAREMQKARDAGEAEDDRWHVRKDGSRFFAAGLMFPLRTPGGRLEGYAKILRDYTDRELARKTLEQFNQELQRRVEEEAARRKAETALSHALADFQMLMDSMTDYAIILLDEEGRVVDWNRGAENILQYGKDEAVGRRLDFIFPKEEQRSLALDGELKRARKEGRSIEERWGVRKNGERFFSTSLLQPLFNGEGRLRGFAKIMRDTTDRKLAEEEANYLANHDQLTGLPNRIALSTRLHHEIARARRSKKSFAFLMLDLNRFKYVNDTLGHDAGDLLLQEVANRLKECVRETDMVARVGGDEFVIIQTGLRKPEDAGILAKKVVKEMAQPFQLNETEAYSGTSIGITLYPKDADNASQLMKNADIAMYRAKSLKQDGYAYFTGELGAQAEERKSLEDRLRLSLDTQELEIHYQPQIDLATWEVTAVEALLRWKNPDMRPIPVSELFHVAEESGTIIQIGKWVLEAVCRQVKSWRASGLPDFHVAINVSPLQLKAPDFLETVRNSLQEHGIQPGWIEMEITERALMETADGASVLEQIKSMGIQISVDDFGTGYSALGYVRHFPIDIVKIDQSLIKHLPNSREDAAIVAGIVDVARNLGLKVIAEGVETPEQLAFLKKHNCTRAQGFLFHPPVPASELAKLMEKGGGFHLHP